jgi:hypothetical protein
MFPAVPTPVLPNAEVKSFKSQVFGGIPPILGQALSKLLQGVAFPGDSQAAGPEAALRFFAAWLRQIADELDREASRQSAIPEDILSHYQSRL